MMKRMSRLISALLVLAMLCAMVPAAMAATLSGKDWGTTPPKDDDSDIIELSVKDSFKMPLPCSTHAGRATIKYYKTLEDAAANKSISGSYLSIDVNTGVITAKSNTANIGTSSNYQDYVVAKLCCSQAGCTAQTEKVFKVRVYNQVSTLAFKLNGTTLKSGDTITLVQDGKLDLDVSFSTSSTSAAFVKKTLSWEDVNDIVKDGSSNIIDGTLTIEAGNKSGKSTLYFYDAQENEVFLLNVKVIDGTTITLKKDGKTVTANKGEVVASGTSFTMTAEAVSASGVSTTAEWSCKDTTIVSIGRYDGKATTASAGKATIEAKIAGVTVSYNIIVTDANSSISIKDDKDILNGKTKQLATGAELNLTATTVPADGSEYVVWSVSGDSEILDLSSSTNYDKTTNTVTGKDITVKRADGKTGTAKLTATFGPKVSASVTFTATDTKTVTQVLQPKGGYTIRDNSSDVQLRANFQEQYPKVPAVVGKDEEASIPVTWTSLTRNGDQLNVIGYLQPFDAETNTTYVLGAFEKVEATATITNEAMPINITATVSSASAMPGDRVTFTCKATADPAGATLSYKWYVDGKMESTSASFTYTVPKEGSATCKAYCEITASKDGKVGQTKQSNEIELKVLRDYEVEVSVDKTSCTVGQSPKATVTVYDCRGTTKKTVSNPNASWKLIDTTKGTELDSKIATISGGTITTKATGKADGQKITVQATYTVGGDTYLGTKEFTLSAASVGAIKMSVGAGATIKSTTVQSKTKDAVKSSSNVTLSYVKFGTPKNCTLTKSSGSSSAIGSTACYFSTTSGQKLSDVYVTLANGASAGSVSYTVYDNNDNTVATGTINFDSSSTGSITCLGIDFADANAAELIAEEFPEAEYVKFNALDVKYGRLLLGYKGIVEIDSAKDVKDSDKYYLKNSSSVDGVEELYLLPRTDYYGAINISYTAYSSSKALGEGTLTFTVVRKTASSKFTDVTSANVGSWAADAIDFMADNSLVGGVGNNKFNPTGTMTRCDLVLIMYRMAGQPSVTGVENPFTDVNTNDYFYKAVLWAYKNGVVNGTGADTFSPKKNITREQIASILFRYSGATTASGSLTSFTDAGSVSDYATTAMKWAVGAGIIGGSNGKLDPQGNATRAQVAVMLHRFLNK